MRGSFSKLWGGPQPQERDFQRLGIEPYSVSEVDGNLVTNAGWNRLLILANAGTGNLVASTTARVGAGNGAGTAAAGDTDLSAAAGSANRDRKSTRLNSSHLGS